MCTNAQLNATMKDLSEKVEKLTDAVQAGAVQHAELSAAFNTWRSTRCDANASRILTLEKREREDKSKLDALGGKATLALSLVILGANVVGPIIVKAVLGG